MKVCPKCNNSNDNKAIVCKHCGASLNAVPEVDPNQEIASTKHAQYKFALFLAILAVGCTLFRELLGPEENFAHFTIYFILIFFSIALCALSVIFMKGMFVIKPLPGEGIAALLAVAFCGVVLLLDLISLPDLIRFWWF